MNERLLDLAAREAMRQPAPQQVRIDPVAALCNYFGFSIPVAKELQISMEPCLCGACAGQKLVINAAMHFRANVGPEVISRHVVPAPSAKPTHPDAENLG